MGKLEAIANKLENRISGIIKKGKKPSRESVKSQVSKALCGQHMKKLIKSTIGDHSGIPTLTYKLDTNEYTKLADTYLGKNIIITDNHGWSTVDIILTYRSQYIRHYRK